MEKINFSTIFVVIFGACCFWTPNSTLGSQILTNVSKGISCDAQQVESHVNMIPLLKYSQLDDRFYEPIYQRRFERFFFTKHEEFDRNSTMLDLFDIGLLAKQNSIVWSDLHIHRYDSFSDFKLSGGPKIDHQKCGEQLSRILDRAELVASLKTKSNDNALVFFLDTFGRAPPGIVTGASTWIGRYKECLEQQIVDHVTNTQMGTRYCLATFSYFDSGSQHWLPLKIGACLPEVCDSSNVGEKYQQINRLVHMNSPFINYLDVNITGLYCLPDPDSKITDWRQSAPAVLLVSLLGGWILLMVYCSLISRNSNSNSNPNPNSNSDSDSDIKAEAKLKPNHDRRRGNDIYLALSLTNNARLLFSTNKESNLIRFDKDQDLNPNSSPSPKADFGCVDGIKVLTMLYVIMGHLLMCLPLIVENSRAFNLGSSLIIVSHMMPGFAVNAFFSITGLLSTYIILMHNRTKRIISKPSVWLGITIVRYFRVMPVYLFVVAFMKYVYKYIGSGPFWDYGTSSISFQKNCENEPWSTSLMLMANFKNTIEHCVPSAWYIANDFQFFLLLPILLIILERKPRLAQRLITLGIIASFVCGVLSIYLNDKVSDLRPILNFKPHGFKIYTSYFDNNYTQPQNRISSYLIGVMIGHQLFRFLTHQRESDPNHESISLSYWWIQRGSLVAGLSLILLPSTPVIGRHLPLGESVARVVVSLFIPSYHIIFSFATGGYIASAATGNATNLVTRILSSPIWKPLARLSLCVALVNLQVCMYLIQTHTQFIYITFQSHLSLLILSTIVIYLASTVLCLIIESPIRAVFSKLSEKMMNNHNRVTKSKIN